MQASMSPCCTLRNAVLACLLCGLASWSCANAARGQQGESCETSADCADMPCVDNVCCATACDQLCESCALPGSEGTCTAIADGEDPDAECGTLNCATQYAGWTENACFWGTTVSAEQATCNGARACHTPEQECPASIQGAQASECDSLCQAPQPDTCQGDIPGACTNLDQGTETCGFGACQVTMPRCVEGVATPCEPDDTASSPEVCNGQDDDCDGLIDDDWAEPNDDCTEFQNLVGLGSNQYIDHDDLTVYVAGDTDYFRVTATESDATCTCCDSPTCQDEDYELYLYLTAPQGIGSYEFCAATDCANVDNYCVNVPAGGNRTLTFSLDGSCSTIDSYQVFVRVRGGNPPGNSCTPYLFSYEFVTGCFGV